MGQEWEEEAAEGVRTPPSQRSSVRGGKTSLHTLSPSPPRMVSTRRLGAACRAVAPPRIKPTPSLPRRSQEKLSPLV